jgi:YVTN family beta-propeller protein
MLCLLSLTVSAAAPPKFTLFESGHVRPLALAPDSTRLYALNTPDGRLEIFDVTGNGLVHRASVPVGLEPVSLATDGANRVWVVNQLSDSISIVDVSGPQSARVVRTLLVGDEPRDIVFAGPGRRRAFITTAHRGQNSPVDPQLFQPGVGRADVWVFDADDLGNSLGGTPQTIVTLFSDTPRALAVSPDGTRVYAAAFHSGNRTTTIPELAVPDGGEAFGGLPGPRVNAFGEAQPETGMIVQFNGQHWVDSIGRAIWDAKVPFSLPDQDVFVLDAMSSTPQQLAGGAGYFSGVGTVLFNMAVNPVSGKVYVSNTEANNLNRFEGPGILAGSSIRGHLHESRITVLAPGSVQPRHLNKHIDYSTCCAALPNTENARSLALPMGMAVSADGTQLYVAAFGSNKIGIYAAAALESDTFVPSTSDQIALSGGGPSGLVLDEPRGRLYVMTRFNNSIAVIDTATRAVTAQVAMFNPEPATIVQGRRFLYDASLSSSHGDSACASCHVFGDFDSLAWDLGNPDAASINNALPEFVSPLLPPIPNNRLQPMKGPMTTQSLRGLPNHGSMHWRGDRTEGNDEPSVQPNGGIFNEAGAFKRFNPAFADLLGRNAPLSASDMQAFTDFALNIVYPPNPIRSLDNSLTPEQQAGRDIMSSRGGMLLQPDLKCMGCHVTNPTANAEFGVPFPGFFGTDGNRTVQIGPIKVPHLRNLYQKVGKFGMTDTFGAFPSTGFLGPQVRGFGFIHDGSLDTVTTLHGNVLFGPFGSPGFFSEGETGVTEKRNLAQFLMAFDSNLAPIVGQQITLTAQSGSPVQSRIDKLIARANAGECELIAKTRAVGKDFGFLYDGAGHFMPNRAALPPITDATLRQLVNQTGRELTYTCTPVGSGQRLGLDRDLDGILDGDE